MRKSEHIRKIHRLENENRLMKKTLVKMTEHTYRWAIKSYYQQKDLNNIKKIIDEGIEQS